MEEILKGFKLNAEKIQKLNQLSTDNNYDKVILTGKENLTLCPGDFKMVGCDILECNFDNCKNCWEKAIEQTINKKLEK